MFYLFTVLSFATDQKSILTFTWSAERPCVGAGLVNYPSGLEFLKNQLFEFKANF